LSFDAGGLCSERAHTYGLPRPTAFIVVLGTRLPTGVLTASSNVVPQFLPGNIVDVSCCCPPRPWGWHISGAGCFPAGQFTEASTARIWATIDSNPRACLPSLPEFL
ncbi:unnamed protein product, partial [Ixodes persulcatus]